MLPFVSEICVCVDEWATELRSDGARVGDVKRRRSGDQGRRARQRSADRARATLELAALRLKLNPTSSNFKNLQLARHYATVKRLASR